MTSINILVSGAEKYKFINRLCNGNYDEVRRNTELTLHTTHGLFYIKFVPLESYIVKYDVTYEIDINNGIESFELSFQDLKTILCLDHKEIPRNRDKDNISIRCYFGLIEQIMYIIRDNEKNHEIQLIESPAIEPAIANI